jgi:YD repeat-containing protein
MNRHTHTSGKIILTIVAILMQVLCLNGIAQNINNPNKTGPMGLQVNTYTGNLFFSRTDVVIPSRGFSLVIGFSYNSFNFNQAGPFGNGWSINYDIKYLSDPEGNKTIVWGDGREDYYVKSGNNYTTPTGFYTQLEEYQPGRLRLTQRDGTEYYFDNATHRRITGMKEPNGNQQSFTYADTLLTGITSPSGQTLSLAYNSNGSLSTLTDANNNPIRTWTYQYDAAGNLVKVIDPLTNEYRYGYLVNGPIKEVRDRNGNVVNIIYYNNYAVSEMIGCNQRISITYDEATLTTVATDHMENGEDQATKYMYKKINDNIWLAGIQGNCCGFKMDFEYDDAGNKIKEVDANGNNTRYTYDEKGNVLTVTDALNHVYSFTYTSDFNFLKSTTDPKGFTSEMTYDARGNLLQIKDAGNRIFTATYADNGDILTSTDPKGNVYNYTYDVFGNPIEVTGPHGYRATMAYDARGRLLSYTDSRNQLSVAEYDILNRLQKITDPLNQSYNMKYDANGNLIKVINPASETLKISYDASDRPVILEDAIGQSTTLKYDEQNNLTNFQNVINQTIQLKYDKQNRLKKATNNAGEHSAFEYDNNGNLTMVILPNGRQLSFVYDKLDRLVKLEDADGTVGEMTYDENNNISSYKNGTGALITATFDALKRPIKINDPLGNSVLLEYDVNGKISRIIDLNGNSTSYEYDGRNRPIKITDQLGSTIQIAYDLNNNMSSLTDQKGNVTSYQYDELNRLTRTTYSDGKFMEYGYDQKNNLIIAKVTDGGNIHYNYDSLNRMIAKTLPDGNTYTYTYDGLSRVLTATNAAGTVSFGYDQLNRLTSETYKGRTVLYTYDTEGRKQTITYPDGTEVTMQYDKRNRLTNVMENGSPVANYTYNGFDQQTSRILANGIGSYYQYDIANRLVGYSTANKQQVRIKYDKLGNKTEVQRLHAPQLSERFVYDANNRLTGYQRGLISSPDMQQSYNYDALGNRISATINGVLTTSINNNLNQLIQLQSGANNRTLLYDENGNLRFDGKFYKTYDAEKRLLKDSASPAAVYTYLYDALGRRISKTINGQLFEYSFAGMLPIEERTGAHQRSKQIFGGFLTPLSIEYYNQRYYYEQNEQGSVESISNSNGQLIERYEYDPMANSIDSTLWAMRSQVAL